MKQAIAGIGITITIVYLIMHLGESWDWAALIGLLAFISLGSKPEKFELRDHIGGI